MISTFGGRGRRDGRDFFRRRRDIDVFFKFPFGFPGKFPFFKTPFFKSPFKFPHF